MKGLITRVQNEENRRKVEIRITDAGLDLLSEIDVIHTDFQNSAVSNLTDEELLTLNSLLIKIRNNE